MVGIEGGMRDVDPFDSKLELTILFICARAFILGREALARR